MFFGTIYGFIKTKYPKAFNVIMILLMLGLVLIIAITPKGPEHLGQTVLSWNFLAMFVGLIPGDWSGRSMAKELGAVKP